MRAIKLAVLVTLAAAAAYEAAVALGWLAVGPLPGQTPAGYDAALGAGLLALVVGATACASAASAAPPRADLFAFLVGPVAAAFVLARFYSFDAYYAPTLRRMSDDGLVPDAWVYAVVALALLAAAVTSARPRIGLSVTAVVLLVAAFTAFFAGVGH